MITSEFNRIGYLCLPKNTWSIAHRYLNEDFKKFCGKVGLTNTELPTLNQSKKVDYRDIHTPYTREITENVYKKEIELLNYKF